MGCSQYRGSEMGGKRLFQSVAADIAGLIDDGAFPSGTRLPGERELAERFGVSRVTIREAEIALQAVGRLEIKTGSGVYVSENPGVITGSLPTASAFATNRVVLINGTLNGVTIATTPSGSRIDMENLPGTSEGMVSPLTFLHKPAAARSMVKPLSNSNIALPIGEPISSIRQSSISALRFSMISAVRNNQSSRSFGSVSL